MIRKLLNGDVDRVADIWLKINLKAHYFISNQYWKRYLQKHKREVYTTLLVNGKLNSYLADIDERATTMMFRLIEQMADKEGITEQLKAADQMAWVGAMNNIRNRATEIVNAELIYL